MKSKLSVIIGSIFAAYIAFVAVIVLVYEPSPDEMNWEDRQLYNRQKLAELTLGQNITEVVKLMGNADFSEASSLNDEELHILFYRTHKQIADGVTSKDECTPLVFKNNKLIAWGEGTYQQFIGLSDNSEPKPPAP
ncbi:DUF3192 domain-containing protein [Shewanella acanthi]|uniref:DUF3192 domain-containing protein n=1 Tax=Shewanella acanthi TaxID=2864212 RepID=UPI001C656483|nr:DUF3192 domain-containing protein [Shewanella acanthi]QYJ77865.1 DUF3192 domain-containing protein [Shewanella acanthi]